MLIFIESAYINSYQNLILMFMINFLTKVYRNVFT